MNGESPDSEHDAADSVPSPSIAPVAVALGVVVSLVGLIVSPWIAVFGAALAVSAGWVWIRGNRHPVPSEASTPEVQSEDAGTNEASGVDYDRGGFLSVATIGLGGLLGALIALPAAAFAIVPSFQHRRQRHIDLGPIANFPEGRYVATTFELDPRLGTLARRTAFVRYNGLVGNEPSFTIISNRCTHVGCPTQPNGPLFTDQAKNLDLAGSPVRLVPVQPAGFGCPCHGSQFDTEGNRVAGPAVRALDRFEFEIVNERLVLTDLFSVARVDGAGADAKIHRVTLTFPGEPVTGLESLLYPVQPPTN